MAITESQMAPGHSLCVAKQTVETAKGAITAYGLGRHALRVNAQEMRDAWEDYMHKNNNLQ